MGAGVGSGIASVGANVGSSTGIPAAGPEEESCLSSTVGRGVNAICGIGGALGIGGAEMPSKKGKTEARKEQYRDEKVVHSSMTYEAFRARRSKHPGCVAQETTYNSMQERNVLGVGEEKN